MENKSGAPATNRTSREVQVMATFEFPSGHIAHANTLARNMFSPISPRLTSEKHGDSCSEMSDLSAVSMVRRKNLTTRLSS